MKHEINHIKYKWYIFKLRCQMTGYCKELITLAVIVTSISVVCTYEFLIR